MKEPMKISLNQKYHFAVLVGLVREGALSDKAAKFLGLSDNQGRISFGPQSSAQASIFDGWGTWTEPKNYYYKTYDMPIQEFLERPLEKMKAMKLKMKIAVKKASKEGKVEDLKLVNSILENGADIESHNRSLSEDPQTSWRILDKIINGKSLDELKAREW